MYVSAIISVYVNLNVMYTVTAHMSTIVYLHVWSQIVECIYIYAILQRISFQQCVYTNMILYTSTTVCNQRFYSSSYMHIGSCPHPRTVYRLKRSPVSTGIVGRGITSNISLPNGGKASLPGIHLPGPREPNPWVSVERSLRVKGQSDGEKIWLKKIHHLGGNIFRMFLSQGTVK